MSTTTASVASGAWTVPAAAKWFVSALTLVLFVLAAAVSAERKDVTHGYPGDELEHASYVAHIQHTGDAWPALASMRLLDPQTFQFTGEANYLNHPPMFYALLAAIGPKLEGRPQALLVYRLLDVALAAAGLAALLALALTAGFSRQQFYAYVVPLAFIPVLVPLACGVTNDNLAFLGGALATLGAWQLLATGRGSWLALALAGVVAAGWAKLTGLLLTAAMVSGVFVYLGWRGRWRWTWTMAAVLAIALAAAPYLIYVIQYGSLTPETPAQTALLQNAGWADFPRKSFPDYLAYFVVAFVANWMPTSDVRSAFQYAMLAVPVAALGCALAGVALSLRRVRHRRESPLDVVVIAGAIALAATFAIHITFSYGRHLASGSLLDAYPRYYLPLAAIVPLAGLSLLAAINAPRCRVALFAFLVAGPMVFGIFG